MSSPFQGLSIGLSALLAHQRAMETTSQNVANVNTPGYSRQSPELAAIPPNTATLPGESLRQPQVGAGVDVLRIRRFTADLIDRHRRSEAQGLGWWETQRDGLQQVEAVFQEPSEQALNAALDNFWSAWHDLSNDPRETAARTQVLQQAGRLATMFNRLYDGLTSIQSDMDHQITGLVDVVNAKAAEIADLNAQIRRTLALGGQPNELLDRRDARLDELAKIADIQTMEQADGTVSVSLSGHSLVFGHEYARLAAETDSTTNHVKITWADDHTPVRVAGGQLGAAFDLRDTVVPEQLTQLDQLASAIITNVNTLHRAGYDLNNRRGGAFFDGTGAADMTLNLTLATDPTRIAAAGRAGQPGDGSQALKIAQLVDTPVIGTQTAGDFYRALIARLGGETQHASDRAAAQKQLVSYFDEQKQSVTGVNLDEEAVRLVESQKAYQAAARVINAMDEALDRLINGTGLVGR